MARITVEDCLDKVNTRYELILLAAKRARQLTSGRRRSTLETDGDKATVTALREIEAGLVSPQNINELKVDIADLEEEFTQQLSEKPSIDIK
ncbi:MAG: DNA-directed RNA polymerase subunit omega [SAR86 cluster bacterium]|jgi:DNA-directed RNA polymerase subunit omega|nr:DNA-directed RNA polymerase subunit omega [SAR86 cluster bacterium]|tara:strand:+ start:22265 stop:22540 length:276 start_codon:yes stop_codon:yes gene_type:complete